MKEFVIGKNDAGQRLDRWLAKTLPLLPAPLSGNLRRGYEAFAAMADIADDDCDDLLDECDDVFYANEAAINDLLRAYADSIVL